MIFEWINQSICKFQNVLEHNDFVVTTNIYKRINNSAFCVSEKHSEMSENIYLVYKWTEHF